MSYQLTLLGSCELRDATGAPVDLPKGKAFAILALLALEETPAARQHLAMSSCSSCSASTGR